MSDTDWSEVSSKKTKNRASAAAGGTSYYAPSTRVVQVAGVKTGTGRKAPVPQGKVFVGGLSWDTDEESLHSYFSEYGEICALEIPRGENKVPRGFAFVTFTDPDVVAEVVGPRHWIDNHPVEVKPAVGIGHEALQQPGKSLTPTASFSTPKAAAVESAAAIQPLQPPLSTQNPNTAAPSQTQAAPIPTPAPSRPITAWSGAVVKNAAAAAASNLPVFTPDDFPPALSSKSTTAAAPAPPKPSLSYASMVGRPPPASQPSRSIASVGSAADMTSENRSALVARAVMQLGITPEQLCEPKAGMVVSSRFWDPPDAGAIVSGQTVVVFRLKNNSTNKLHKLLHACTVPPRPGFEFCLMKQGPKSDATNASESSIAVEIGPPLSAAGVDIPAGTHVDVAVRIIAPTLGRFKQMTVFKFNGFLIGAFVNVSVINENDANVIKQQGSTGGRSVWSTGGWTSSGTESAGRSQDTTKIPSDIRPEIEQTLGAETRGHTVQLPEFRLPPEFSGTDAVVPVINGPITRDNYRNRLHMLVYLEERQQILNMNRYKLQQALLSQCTSYDDARGGVQYFTPFPATGFLVPGLGEKRPSVMTYDIVYARNLCNASTGAALTDPNVEYEGFVKRLSGERVFVQFTRNFHEKFGQDVLADVRFSYQRRTYRLLHQAVDLVDLNRVCPSEATLASEAIRANAQRRHASAEVGINSFDPSLNEGQRSAVKSAFALANGSSPFLVFGPFGSGKTRVCSAILRLFAANPAATILVCCPSNSAADVYINFFAKYCETLSLSPKSILRIYAAYRRRESVSPHVLPFCYVSAEGNFECPPLSVVTAARIVVTTFTTSATLVGMGVPKDHFKVILLDEAAQANEVEALIPMSLAGPSSQVILAGDAKQLGGTVLSAESRRFGMGASIMERLSSLPIYSSSSAFLCAHLTANFRCHSAILDCASQVFYSGLLQACGDVSSLSLSHWRRLHNSSYPVCCIHVEGQDQLAPDSPSFYNMYEASTVAVLVSELIEDTGCAQGEIAVLAPFSKQIETIRLLLRSRKLSGVKVCSVEDIQGQEYRAVFVSVTRSEAKNLHHDLQYGIGFLGFPRRLNTAISRSRALLVLVCDPDIVTSDSSLKSLVDICKAKGNCDGWVESAPASSSTMGHVSSPHTVASPKSAFDDAAEMIKNFVTFDLDDQDAASPNGLFAWPPAGEVPHVQSRASSHHNARFSQYQQQQQQQQQFSQQPGSAWGHASSSGVGSTTVDPWGRPFSTVSSTDSDPGSSQLHGRASWNQDPGQSSNQNGWFGGFSRNDQQSSLVQPQVDHRIGQYVVGLPAEIVDQARIMDTLYMHLNVAWSAMNYSSIAYLAGELQRISTMLYQWVVSAIPVAHAQQDADLYQRLMTLLHVLALRCGQAPSPSP